MDSSRKIEDYTMQLSGDLLRAALDKLDLLSEATLWKPPPYPKLKHTRGVNVYVRETISIKGSLFHLPSFHPT